MAKTVNEIKCDLVQSIAGALNDNQTVDEITEILKDKISTAFSKIKVEDRAALRKQLSLSLHPDKLKTTNPAVFEILKKHNVVDTPQQLINECQDEHGIGRYEHGIGRFVAQPMGLIASMANKLKKVFGSMPFVYKRYPQPLSSLVNITSWVINIVLLAVSLSAFIVTKLLSALNLGLNFAKKTAFNFLTANRYGINSDEKKSNPAEIEQSKREVLLRFRDLKILLGKSEFEVMSLEELEAQRLKNIVSKLAAKNPIISHDQLWEQARNELTDEINKVTDNRNNFGWNSLVLALKSLHSVIKDPVPANKNKLLAYAVKAGQIAAFTLVLVSEGALHLVGNLIGGAFMSLILIAAATKVATLAVLNSPLYLYDAANTLKDRVKSYFQAPKRGEYDVATDVPVAKQDMSGQNTPPEHHSRLFLPPPRPIIPDTTPKNDSGLDARRSTQPR